MSWGSSGEPGLWDGYTPIANEREGGTRNKRRTTSTNYQTDKRNKARSKGRTPEPYVYPGHYGQMPEIDNVDKIDNFDKGGKNRKKKKKVPEAEIYARPIVPISQIQVPIGSGQAITPNMQEAYIKEVTRLTLNLISSADNLLFAYNFSTIDRIASYMLEADDASQRSTGVVSNIRRAIEGVPLTELEIRDRLNGVVNLVANTIGDLVPSDRKLNLFGNKKDNLPFQGGMPRINNRTSFYDLELDLPELSSPEYSVTYVIKCYDIS
jgi:hypothetical protein